MTFEFPMLAFLLTISKVWLQIMIRFFAFDKVALISQLYILILKFSSQKWLIVKYVWKINVNILKDAQHRTYLHPLKLVRTPLNNLLRGF